MTSHFEDMLAAYGAVIPDLPVDEPCYKVNRSLWALYRRLDPTVQEHPVCTEAEIVRRLDLLYMGAGIC